MRKMMTIIGVLLIIIAVLLLIFARQGFMLRRYKKEGITVQATVFKKYSKRINNFRVSQYRPNRFHVTSSTDYLLDVSFFTGERPKGIKFITAMAYTGKTDISGLKKGDKVAVVYLPGDPQNTCIIKSAIDKGFFDALVRDNYLKNGVTVEATVDDVHPGKDAVRVMFMSRLFLNIGEGYRTTVSVDQSVWDNINTGDKIDVVYLKDKPTGKVFAAEMIERGLMNPALMIGLALLSVLSGIFLMWFYRKPAPDKHTEMMDYERANR